MEVFLGCYSFNKYLSSVFSVADTVDLKVSDKDMLLILMELTA